LKKTNHFIGGRTVSAKTYTLPVYDPSNGEQVAITPIGDDKIIAQAANSARRAFPAWSAIQPAKRGRIMQAYHSLVAANSDEICSIITKEHGKTMEDAKGELGRGLENIEYACGISEHLKGEHSKSVGPDIDSWSEFAPLGICLGITPFNFPAMVPLWMFPLAVACGNTFILKPSEKVPSTSLRLAELFHEAGLPAGVLNVVQGDSTTADKLMRCPEISAVSFVGSTPAARAIYSVSSASGKRVQALGGAKNHAIVLPDADLEMASNAIMGAAYGSCGQRCMALSVVVTVGRETSDQLANTLANKVARLTIGPGRQNLDMGPVNSAVQLDKILALVESGVSEGADLLVDGRLNNCCHQPGYFLGGCLFDNVKTGMRIYQEEIFGPVLCLIRAETASEALEIVNGNQYGNGASIFTRDGHAARQFASGVQAGMVGINVPLPVPAANHSFGGWKDSRYGDLAAYGPDGVRFYTRRKTITERWLSSDEQTQIDFSFPGGK